jgi:hypothetical protein
VAVWGVSALFYLEYRVALPLAVASLATGLLIAVLFAAWARYGRDVVSLGRLMLAIPYALWKIPLYAKFLVARQIDWVRSKRDQERST